MIPPVLDLDVIDAHHHLCHLSAASYPWLEGPPVVRYHGDDIPLRRDYLLDDYADNLDDQGKEYLQRVRAGSHRMGQLIDGLLKLSRITRAEMERRAPEHRNNEAMAAVARASAADRVFDKTACEAAISDAWQAFHK